MGVVLSAKQKEEMGLLGPQPSPPPDPCPRCEQEKAELAAKLAEAEALVSEFAAAQDHSVFEIIEQRRIAAQESAIEDESDDSEPDNEED